MSSIKKGSKAKNVLSLHQVVTLPNQLHAALIISSQWAQTMKKEEDPHENSLEAVVIDKTTIREQVVALTKAVLHLVETEEVET